MKKQQEQQPHAFTLMHKQFKQPPGHRPHPTPYSYLPLCTQGLRLIISLLLIALWGVGYLSRYAARAGNSFSFNGPNKLRTASTDPTKLTCRGHVFAQSEWKLWILFKYEMSQ